MLSKLKAQDYPSFPEPVDLGTYGELCTTPFWGGDNNTYTEVASVYEELVSQGIPSELNNYSTDKLEQLLSNRLLATAGEIEKTKDWGKVQELFDIPTLANPNPNSEEPYVMFAILFAFAIRWLIGNEDKHLVGTRKGQAVWMSFTLPKNPSIETLLKLFPVDAAMRYLDRNDLDILPKPGEWVTPRQLMTALPSGDHESVWSAINSLFEDAYYNQHYILNPEGSLVKIGSIPGLDSLILKAKRGVYDRNYHDFIAVFKYDDGKKAVVSMNSELAVNPDDGRSSVHIGTSDIRLVHLLVIAQIYHDLVTKIEVVGYSRSRSSDGATNGVRGSKEVLTLEWTPIPRVSHRKRLEPRIPLANPRSIQPHRVRGHKRRANMTDQQREVLQQFEQETGIEILKWIPEGYTFVRPHISPAGDSQAIQDLPRFIRRRIQSDIKKLLADSRT